MSNEFCGTCGRHYDMCVCAKMSARVRTLGASLFNHIKHGDAEHQEWLKREALVWCALNFGDEPAAAAATPAPSSMPQYCKCVAEASCPNRADCIIDMVDLNERKCPADHDPFDGPEFSLNRIFEVRMPVNPKWIMRCYCRVHGKELVRVRDQEGSVSYELA